MLILTRKRNQSLFIDGEIKITVIDLSAGQVRLGIEAPPKRKVYREEVLKKMEKERSDPSNTSSI